jgi:roadblock/LC7 domain-containing protein
MSETLGAAGPPPSPPSPVRVELQSPLKVARWRPLVHWLLAIPQWIVLYALGIVLGALQLVAFFTVLITREIPPNMFAFMVMIYRYQWRVGSYVLWMREEYPPFDFTGAVDDPGTDPARLTIAYPGQLRRFMPLVKWLLAIPHYFVLFFLGIAVWFVEIVAFFATIITGRWPSGMRDFVVGVVRWVVRVQAYVYFMTDDYPPFSLS